MSFSQFALPEPILRAVEESGYTEPTPIQRRAIPLALAGRDILGIAQTGTGKTASFTLPILAALGSGRARARMPRALILCPTRELAAQVADNFSKYGKYGKLTMALLIGGVSFDEQNRALNRGADVLIATPGRLIDHFERGRLMLNGVQMLVIDEADRMLDMGFIPDIEKILALTPFTRHTMLFSATMPPEVARLADTFLHNPEHIAVTPPASVTESVDQRLVRLAEDSPTAKRAALRAVIAQEGEALVNAIVFCNRKRDVDVLYRSLAHHGMNAAAIHGDLDQHKRTQVLNAFRTGDVRFLVASDVAARGLDIPRVSHVLNFDIPVSPEDYVHRIGRTGRAGRSGVACSIATRADGQALRAIEDLLGQPIPHVVIEGLETDYAETTRTDPPQGAREPGRGRRGGKKKRKSREGTQPRERPKPERRRSSGRRSSSAAARDSGESAGSIVGFGDSAPAFMLRAPSPKAPGGGGAGGAENAEAGAATEKG